MQWTANRANSIPSQSCHLGSGRRRSPCQFGTTTFPILYSKGAGLFPAPSTATTTPCRACRSNIAAPAPDSQPALSATNNTLSLLSGGIESPGSITVSSIPYSLYDVYVYVSGWSNFRTGYLTLNKRPRLHERRDRRIHGVAKLQSKQPDDASRADRGSAAANRRGICPRLRRQPDAELATPHRQLECDGLRHPDRPGNVRAAARRHDGAAWRQRDGRLDLNGVDQQVAALADNAGCADGLVTDNSEAGAPAILTLSPAGGSSTFSGAIQDGAGAIHLAMSGNGTQVLAGSNNAYSGGTTISAGTLQIGDGAANAGSLPGNVVVSSTAAGALTFNTPAAMSLAYSGNISGAGGLTKAGPGTLTVNSSQTQTYNGATIISGGVLRLAPTTPVGVNMQWTDISSGIIGSGRPASCPPGKLE